MGQPGAEGLLQGREHVGKGVSKPVGHRNLVGGQIHVEAVEDP
jgi:hypothetical protein